MIYSIKEIINIFSSSENIFFNKDSLDKSDPIDRIIIDSRDCLDLDNKLFIAIRGDRDNGNKYIDDLVKNNLVKIVISDDFNKRFLDQKYKNILFIFVNNSLQALIDIAIYARKISKAEKIIAITGSNGKTSVKNITIDILKNELDLYYSKSNFNNEYGMNLLLANMNRNYKYAIFEIGMNNEGEISKLVKILNPHIRVITTISPAHIGNFNDESHIAKAKSEIFDIELNKLQDKEKKVAIINHDNKFYDFIYKIINKDIYDIYSFSFNDNKNKKDNIANFKMISSKIIGPNKANILLNINKKEYIIDLELDNKMIITHIFLYNIFISIIISSFLIDTDLLVQKKLFNNICNIDGRFNLNIINTKSNNKLYIIDDSYNANPSSMKESILFVKYMINNFAIFSNIELNLFIGDMKELVARSKDYHLQIAKIIKDNISFTNLFLIGDEVKYIFDFLNQKDSYSNIFYFKDSQLLIESNIFNDFLKNINIIDNNSLCLFKSSNSLKLNKIIKEFNKIESL